jgi:two-component system sensor histidine kinase QseC
VTGAPRSLQGRLLALVLALVAMVWLATAALTWLDVRDELDDLLDSHLAQAAALLVVQQAGEIDDDDQGIDAPSLHRYAPRVAFQVFHEGRLALRSSNAPVQPMLTLTSGAEQGFRSIVVGGAMWRVFATHGRERDTLVFVGEQVEARHAILWAVLRSVLTPLALALPLLGLAAWFAVRRGLEPLRALGRMLQQRRAQALQPVALAGAPAEMTPLLDALNGLFQRIAALMTAERRFTADAAHELRTPIAAIRMQAQVALASTEVAERRQALQSTLQGCDRATRLVEQLLTLARIESGQAPAPGRLDLAAVVREVVADVAALALSKDQTIAVDASPRAWVDAEATLLSVLVRNLVDNAIRYSPPGARVQVDVEGDRGGPGDPANDSGVCLRIEDSGPGLEPADIERLGERFFRVIGSGQSGSGLGWSIAQRIASVLAVTVHVSRSAALGGLAVELRFAPVSAQPLRATGGA